MRRRRSWTSSRNCHRRVRRRNHKQHRGEGVLMRRSLMKLLAAAIALAPSLLQAQQSAVLLDQVNLVGLPSVAQPSEFSFTAATAQALTVTLTDFKAPAAFVSLQIAVTLDDAGVGPAAAPRPSRGLRGAHREPDELPSRRFLLRQYPGTGLFVDHRYLDVEHEFH